MDTLLQPLRFFTTPSIRPGISTWEWRLSLLFGVLSMLIVFGFTIWASHASTTSIFLRFNLKNGWLLGIPQMDNSDLQYAGFRRIAGSKKALLAISSHLLLSNTVRSISESIVGSCKNIEIRVRAAKIATAVRLLYYVGCGIALLVLAHGNVGAVILVLLVGVHFAVIEILVRLRLGKCVPWATYAYGILTLGLIRFGANNTIPELAAWLYNTGHSKTAIIPWHLSYNFAILRMISYAMDYYWFQFGGITEEKVMKSHRCGSRSRYADQYREMFCCRHARMEYPPRDPNCALRRPWSYVYGSILAYLGYVFYLPLYLAGPIMTYNNWVTDFFTRTVDARSLSARISSTADAVLGVLAMELFLHLAYPVALAAIPLDAANANMFFLFSLVLCNLLHIWLKLFIIWRFFRALALWDGIDAPENMRRFVWDNVSIIGFWKSWHASFNLWLVRYMYIPLGGRQRNRAFSVPLVFAFVALWHEASRRLFVWATLIAASVAIELALERAVGGARSSPHKQILRGVFLILVNMTCNALGFAFATERGKQILLESFSFKLLPLAAACLYSCTSILLELEERRRE